MFHLEIEWFSEHGKLEWNIQNDNEKHLEFYEIVLLFLNFVNFMILYLNYMFPHVLTPHA